MKHIFIDSLKQLATHRRVMVVLIMLLLLAIGTTIYVSVTIHASDLKVITHYSAFGLTHLYRDSWTYLIAFAIFSLLAGCMMAGIALKLLRQDRESLALLAGWLGIGLVVVNVITYARIVGLA